MLEYSFEPMVGTRIDGYQIEQIIEQGPLSTLFLTHAPSNATPSLLRILSIPVNTAEPAATAFRDVFYHQANTIAALQHPYILPLTGYGIDAASNMPYLVWPAIPVRSISSRIAQNGPFDPVTVGRYLDQVAAALEYAHEHMVLHRNLTLATLALQRDGRIIVQDFGVRRILEQGRKDAQWYTLHSEDEACAPEQILGLPATPATDVYALGATLFQMLTGHPLYTGYNREEIAHRHLHAPIPSLRTYRTDLPQELDDILARALAKETNQRFSQPGQLANAYHDIVSPMDTARVPFKPAATDLPAPSPRLAVSPGRVGKARTATSNDVRSGNIELPTLPAEQSENGIVQQIAHRLSPARIALSLVLLLAIVLGGTILALSQRQPAPVASGQAVFMDSRASSMGQTNALTLQLQGLATPAQGYTYHAWMINQQTEQILPLGALTKQKQNYTLAYQGSSINLLAAGTLLEITLEQGAPAAPTGKVILEGIFPPKAFVHIQHLLVAFPTTPGKVGLLVGAEQQISLLDTQAHILSQDAASGNEVAIECQTQSILDIIEGTEGPDYHTLTSNCETQYKADAGDGFGLLGTADSSYQTATGYLPDAAEHAALATSQPDATATLRLHAQKAEAIITNVESLITTLKQDALVVEKAPLAQGTLQAMIPLADKAWHGSVPDNTTADTGITAALSEGQLMATLTLVTPN